MNADRYAIYYAPPPRSALWKYGSRWLGWDAYSGERLAPRVPKGLSGEAFEQLVMQPRRYGFHATLKAPFRLHPECAVHELIEALGVLVESQRQVLLPGLVVDELDGFLALCPPQRSAELDDLAANCVTQLDRFRAPLTDEQIAARRGRGLSAEQDGHLLRWGYPYVLDQYRFHMTLTGRIEAPLRSELKQLLARDLEPITGGELVIDALTLFRQESPERPFQAIMRFPLVSIYADDIHA